MQELGSEHVKTMKRFFDALGSALMLTVLAIPMLIIAILIRATSRGPALYWSDRVGRNNKIFRMPKFRSMRTDTPEMGMHLIPDSKSCITPLGAILRKTSLDEIPQLWSIFTGHMSFVGPRPVLPNEKVLLALRSHMRVDTIRPGLTGWAQVNGRAELPVNKKVKLDQEYLHRRSLLFDFEIVMLTAKKVLVGADVHRDQQADDFVEEAVASTTQRPYV